jgi:hypothetical protein
MAKIIHVSNFGRRPKGAFQHRVENKISNGFIRNGHCVSNFSDRDVARAGSWIGHRKFGVSAANKDLRAFCTHVRPDLLLLGHADVIRPETLGLIRQDIPDIRIVQWNVDPMFEPDNVQRIRAKIDVVDATLVSTAGNALAPLRTGKGHVGFLPNPVDFSVESGHNHEKHELPYDFFYACGNPAATRYTCGKDWLPDDLIRAIETGVPGLRCRLTGIQNYPSLTGAFYQQALESAAIGFNLSRRNDYFLYSSDRVAQMCGNGQAILMDRATGYQNILGEDEFAFFSTVEELIEQTRRLKADNDNRRKRAAAGRAHYHSLFNEQIVARYILDVAFDKVRKADYPWLALSESAI